MFEPRKLIPFSIAYCKAPIAVMTEITEKTPIVIPSIVKLERSLFTPSEPSAILIISLNNMSILLVSQCCYRIEARGRPRWREPGNKSGHNRNDHARDHKTSGKINWERWKCFSDSKTHHVGKRESDKSAQETERSRFDEKLQQDCAPPRTQRFACPDLFCPLFHTHERDIHDADCADKQ